MSNATNPDKWGQFHAAGRRYQGRLRKVREQLDQGREQLVALRKAIDANDLAAAQKAESALRSLLAGSSPAPGGRASASGDARRQGRDASESSPGPITRPPDETVLDEKIAKLPTQQRALRVEVER